MNVVFIGAGAVFGFHGDQFERAAPAGSKFYIVEPYYYRAKATGFEHIDLEEAAKIADIAIIMTPSSVRWSVCEPFIKNNIPIVVEKPLTINWDEIAKFEEAEQNGKWICPVVNCRCIPKVAKLATKNAQLISEVKAWKYRYRSPGYYDSWHGKYATDGGVLAQQGFHCLDLICWVGGKPKQIKAVGEKRFHKIECEDTATVDIVFESGVVGSVFCTTASSDNSNAGFEVTDKNGQSERTEAPMFAKGGKPGHTVLAGRVFEALANKTKPPISVADVSYSLRAMHACYVSMDKNGEWVELGVRHDKLGVPR